jgi:hypothetical protein
VLYYCYDYKLKYFAYFTISQFVELLNNFNKKSVIPPMHHTSRPTPRSRGRTIQPITSKKRKIGDCTNVMEKQSKRLRAEINDQLFNGIKFYIHHLNPVARVSDIVGIIEKHNGIIVHHIDLADFVVWPRAVRTRKDPNRLVEERNITLCYLRNCVAKRAVLPVDITMAPMFCQKQDNQDVVMDTRKTTISCTGYTAIERQFIRFLARLVGARFETRYAPSVNYLITESEHSQKYRTAIKNHTTVITLQSLYNIAFCGKSIE